MSASLVGSEMCIRDSGASGPKRGSVHPWVGCLDSGLMRLEFGPRLQFDSCLLYTSDAADDM
eukprot:5844969-Alexandrium_andersonii.AAC.1